MKTVFIVNPNAGKSKDIDALIADINNISEKLSLDAFVYKTKARGDAKSFVSDYCAEHGAARFIACGGDGTLSEVINGAALFDDVEIGVIPLGTGNDFCRNFPEYNFKNIAAQLQGEVIPCDVIECKTDNRTFYCINMINIGFDCNVADMTAKMKKKSFISGSFAYLISIFAMLIKKKGANLKVELDGEVLHSGRLLLNSIANGSFCGGGIMSNPKASINDGKLNVNVIYNISRANFLTKLPFYMKGTHIKLKNIDNVIYNTSGNELKITPLDKTLRICVDGEIFDAGVCEFKVLPGRINFVTPTGKIAVMK